MPGKPRQQTLNRHGGPRLAFTEARFAHSSRAGGRRRAGVPSRSPDGGKRLAERSLARAQRDVPSGPAAATRPPPGPDARDHPDTRRGYSAPAPRSHAGRRFEVKQEDCGEQEAGLYRAWPWRPRTEFQRGAKGPGLPHANMSPSAGLGPAPQSRRPSPGVDTHRAGAETAEEKGD